MKASSKDTASSKAKSRAEEIWLLGQPSLENYLDFVRESVVEGDKIRRSLLVDEWRAANDYYAELEDTEAGIADTIETFNLPPKLRPLVKKVKADPRFIRAFDELPTSFEMVELDLLLVSQLYVSKHHTDKIARGLSRKTTPEALFNFCQPLNRDEAPVQIRKTGSKSFIFWSESADFRFQEAAVLRPDQIKDFTTFGPMAGVIGVSAGYGSNFLNVIRSGNRMVLHNGYHRAYALRSAGVTHAPCIVQTVSRLDELKLAADQAVVDDPSFYFVAKRPPLLKDFFNPKIRKLHRVHPMSNVIEVTIDVKERKKVRSFSVG
jgi:hypothetical protein